MAIPRHEPPAPAAVAASKPRWRRVRAVAAAVCLLAIAICVAGCAGTARQSAPEPVSWAPRPDERAGLRQLAYVAGDKFYLPTASGRRAFIAGVNLGSTIPGKLPGELATRATDYRRWFPQMSALGLRAIRVYTILRPCFYTELAAYNRTHADAPLYLVQGVWIPEEQFLAGHDLYAPAVRSGFLREIDDAVRAVHGGLRRSPRRGVASGAWTADVSPWLLAYSLGVEWDPVATKASDKKNAGTPRFRGRYFSSTAGASPTESWLAAALDRCAADEARRGLTVPLTFTNWPTTDPLSHPDEPLAGEDLVGVDAAHIRARAAWPAGFFASYHVYPYYPDFQRHEPALRDYRYHGRSDPYAGYLAQLREHHAGVPLMITEFGVPSSLGTAHMGPLGRSQGDHSEQQAMAQDAELLRIIRDQGCAGGFVFEWADEWFKFTWNTVDYELPGERRQLWVNPLTNEEHFGLVATDPGATSVVTIDGRGDEWLDNGSQVIQESRGSLREVRAVKDEGYLYLRLILDDPSLWQRQAITLGIDVLPGGNGGLPGLPYVDAGADYAVVLGPGRQGSALVSSHDDPFWVTYGVAQKYLDQVKPAYPAGPGVGVWHLQRQITNRPLVVPSTGRHLPLEWFDVGKLRFGTTDPASPRFDCRVTWAAGDCVEIRLPYALIGFADPSSRRALVVRRDGTVSTAAVARVGIDVAVGREMATTNGYSWDPWQVVAWHERQKAGIGVLADAVRETMR
jgi:hypothetical protein